MSLSGLLVPGADVAVFAGEVTCTCDELHERADGVAASLRIEPGSTVGVMLPNGIDLVATLFGVWRAGGVYVPINPRLTRPEVERVHRDVGTTAFVSTAGVEVFESSRRFDADVALVQFTSGTTGPPKPVPLLHSTVISLLDSVIGTLRTKAVTKPPMPNLIPVSMSLWAGIYQVLFAFRVGAPIVVMGEFETQAFAELVARHEVRSVVLPPAAMTMLADDGRIESLAPLRYVRSITAPLSPFQARRFKDRFGIAVLNSYGQTELGGEVVGWSAADSREHGEDKLGSVGRPHPGVELRVVDGTGELAVRTAASDGWLDTGDIARIDDDGFVWLEGRVSDVINRGGLKVFPADVEEVLRTAPGVTDVAVVGVPDARLGEVPWAFVVGDVDAAALDAHCRTELAAYKIPVRFEPIAELPRNEIGKVVKSQLLGAADNDCG